MYRLFFSSVLAVTLTACAASVEKQTRNSDDSILSIAEAFIDTFYSFDQVALEAFFSRADDSISSIVYYQGWAEGGNYEIVERKQCVIKASDIASCSITVKDDPMLALEIDFFVTDTFEISFREGTISTVETSSDDLQIYYDARDWVRREMPELIEDPCQGYFDGGLTPGDCARAMAEGYRQFAASDDFPDLREINPRTP